MLTAIAGLCALIAATYAGTGLVAAYARRGGLLDRPGARRLHNEPTPRGGGAAIVAAIAIAAAVLAWAGALAVDTAVALLGALVLVASVGWLDDHRSVRAVYRLGVQLMAALWALVWLGGLPSLALGWTQLELGWAGHALALVGLLWLINLYNFMDGIDALAAGEAIFVGSVLGGWLLAAGAAGLGWLALSVAAATLGFLPWNLPRAHIFMGDVGSSALGLVFGVVLLAGEHQGAAALVIGVLLLGAFAVDATCTLVRRMALGRRWYTAHREHVYQRLVRAGLSHGRVVVLIMLVNGLIALPLTLLAWQRPAWSAAASALGLGTLVALWWLGLLACRRLRLQARARAAPALSPADNNITDP